MKARESRKITISANPDELRALADKMERRYERCRVGDTTFVDFINYDPEEKLTIALHFDQCWFDERKQGNKKPLESED
jgi:hypothetical protein